MLLCVVCLLKQHFSRKQIEESDEFKCITNRNERKVIKILYKLPVIAALDSRVTKSVHNNSRTTKSLVKTGTVKIIPPYQLP